MLLPFDLFHKTFCKNMFYAAQLSLSRKYCANVLYDRRIYGGYSLCDNFLLLLNMLYIIGVVAVGANTRELRASQCNAKLLPSRKALTLFTSYYRDCFFLRYWTDFRISIKSRVCVYFYWLALIENNGTNLNTL